MELGTRIFDCAEFRKFLFLIYIILLLLLLLGGKSGLFQRSSIFGFVMAKWKKVVEWGFALAKQGERLCILRRSRHILDFAWNAGTELRKSLI